MDELDLYKQRFETTFQIAKQAACSLNIGEILEIIRDEVKNALPHVEEACLLMLDPEAVHYTRPLHCAVYEERLNCQLCKRGRNRIQATLEAAAGEAAAVKTVAGKAVAGKADTGKADTGKAAAGKTAAGQTEARSAGKENEIVIPIRVHGEILAVLDVVARRGGRFNERDRILLNDLTALAESLIAAAREHWKAQQEKLTTDRILAHLKPFVPETVKRIVEKNPARPELEKKDQDVSILFLDVAGYTRISERFSRDQVHFMIEKYFSAFLDIISQHAGDVNETAGDGLMSIFNGPPKENAYNAAVAALAIRRRTTEINKELEGRFQPVVINMGINSGLAAVGMTRFKGASGVRMTYTASGETTNLAARIAGVARHGEILVGPQTAARLDGDFVLDFAGEKRLKNVSRPVSVHRLKNQI